MNTIKATVTCPSCKGEVVILPDVFEGNTPVSGICPGCYERLYFCEVYLSSFDLEGVTKDEQPTYEVQRLENR